jgi:hypothetical protein
MKNLTTEILMQLIDGYAETRHVSGHPTYNEKSALARKLVEAGIGAVVKAANPPLFDMSKGIPPATSMIGLPVISPEMLEVGK